MRTLLIVFIFCLPFSEAFAQQKQRVSGFIGKRLLFGLGADFSLSRHPQKQSDVSYHSTNANKLNKAFNAQVEYVIANYFSMGVRGGTLSTSVTLPFDEGLEWKDDFGEHTLKTIRGTPGVRAYYFGLYGKKFRKKSAALAPVGRYFVWGMNFHTFNLDYSNLRFYTQSKSVWGDPAENVYKFEKTSGRLYGKEVFIELGKAIPINDRYMMDFSFKTGFLIYGSGLPPTNSGNPIEGHVNNMTRHRLKGLYYFNYSVKFHIML